MGYFFSKLQRRKGKVILLYKGQLEPPSDISGIIYIDISNGIEAAGEQIRKELSSLLER
jgi:predicted nucleotide-binding protein